MKKFIGILSLLFAISSMSAIAAEESAEVKQALQQKKLLILEGMQLSDDVEIAFLPVYNSFQKEKLKINRQLSALVEDFAKNYNDLSNAKAQEIINKWQLIQQSELDLKKDYVSEFTRVISPKQTMRYYQIENKLDTMVDYELIKAIPLAH